MGSKRLPGKVMNKILNKPILHYMLNQVRRSALYDKIIIATSIKKKIM